MSHLSTAIVNANTVEEVEALLRGKSSAELQAVAKELNVNPRKKTKQFLTESIIQATVVAKNRSNTIRNYNLENNIKR